MPFDEQLAERVRAVLRNRTELTERRMFGGFAFLLHGHTCVGIAGRDLMVRVGADRHEEAGAFRDAAASRHRRADYDAAVVLREARPPSLRKSRSASVCARAAARP